MQALKLLTDSSLVGYSTWIEGTTGSTAGTGPAYNYWNEYTVNTSLNRRTLETDPWGRQSVCWQGLSGNSQAGQGNVYGGFNVANANASYQLVPVDNTKTYRFSCWIKRKNIVAGQGNVYFGLWATSGLTRNSIIATPTYSTTNNPYPISTSPSQTNGIFPEDQWRLCVAHLRPYTTPTGTTLHADTGVYQPNGIKLTTGMTITDYIMLSDTYNVGIRVSPIFNVPSGTTVTGYALYPRIDLVDGTEPSIEKLLKGENPERIILKDSSRGNNLLDYSSWINGTTGSTAAGLTTSFTQYTPNSTNYRAIDTDPYGNDAVVWVGFGNNSGATAGFQSTGPTTGILIDNTKNYRFSIWTRLIITGASISNRFYFGYNPRKGGSADFSFATTATITGVSNNYYFLPAISPIIDTFPIGEWRLCVGYLMAAGTPLLNSYPDYIPKIYNLTGGTVYTSIYNYIMSGSTTGVHMRIMMPYQSTSVMQSVYPRIDLVDGTEPTLAELLSGERVKKIPTLRVLKNFVGTVYSCPDCTSYIDVQISTYSTNIVLNKYYASSLGSILITSIGGNAEDGEYTLVGPYNDCATACAQITTTTTTTTTSTTTTTTTTAGPTTTTTTTAAPATGFFQATRYTCPCGGSLDYLINALTPVTIGKYYKSGTNIFYITGTGGVGFDGDYSMDGGPYDTCEAACS